MGDRAVEIGDDKIGVGSQTVIHPRRALVALLGLLGWIGPIEPAEAAAFAGVDAFASGVVEIAAFRDGEATTGAGFIVALDSTGAHVVTTVGLVAGSTALEVTFATQRERLPGRVARMQGGDELGIAVVWVEGPIPIGVRRLPLATQPVDPELEVRVIPPGLRSQSVVEIPPGALSAIGSGEMVFETPDVMPFVPGSPLVQKGDVVGILREGEDHRGSAVSVLAFRDRLDAWGVSARIELANPGHELRAAAQRGDALRIELLLDEVDLIVDARDGGGRTALHLAVSAGHAVVVESLLTRGATVDAIDESGGTPLHLAVHRRRAGLLRRLLEAGAEPNRLTGGGDTPLHLAIGRRDVDLVRVLADHGADLEIKNAKNRTPLVVALEQRELDIARALLAAGADPNSTNDFGLKPLGSVANLEDLTMAKQLIAAGAEVDSGIGSALFWSNIPLARLLFDLGANVDTDEDGNSLVHTAVGFGRRESLELLIEVGSDLTMRNSNGQTPLERAQVRNKRGVLEVLEAALAKQEGEDVLYEAIIRDQLTVVRSLLEQGVETGLIAGRDEPLLHLAVRRDAIEILRLLLDAGADIEAHNEDRETPLFLAADTGKVEAAELLIARGADVNSQNGFNRDSPLIALTRIWETSRNGARIARLLLDRGADIDYRGKFNAAIHRAAAWGQWSSIPFFLEHGADIHLRDHRQNTILHLAAEKGHVETIRLALEQGADLRLRNGLGQTPLGLARQAGHPAAVRLLETATMAAAPETSKVASASLPEPLPIATDTPLDELKAGVVKIVARRHGARKIGGGFVVALDSKSAHILTASHVVTGSEALTVAFHPRRFQPLPAKRVHGSGEGEQSVSVIVVEGEIPVGVRRLEVLAGPIELSRTALTVGFPSISEEDWTVHRSALFSAHGEAIALAGDGIAEGSSGGPLLQGSRVIGVIQSLAGARAYATPGATIREALDRWDLRDRIELEDPGKELRLAARRGDVVRVEILLREYPRQVNSQNHLGQTALHLAIAEGHEAVVEALVAARAGVDVEDEHQETPLHYATRYGRLWATQHLFAAEVNLDATSSGGETPLHEAIRHGESDLVQRLIDGGADLERQDGKQATPLYVASGAGHTEIARMLLSAGADPNSRNLYDERSPLEHAIGNRHLEIARLLVERGADVNQLNGWRAPPTRMAIAFRYLEGVRFLLEHGADVHCKGCGGVQPIHTAAQVSSPEVVTLLLERGAVPDARNFEGQTPLDIARANNRPEIVALLESAVDRAAQPAGGSFSVAGESLLRASRQGDFEELARLLARPEATAALVGPRGHTPLHLAVSGGHRRAAELLIDHGAPVDARDDDQETPLYEAIARDRLESARLLLQRGAAVSLPAAGGDAPLHLAVRRNATAFVELLLDHGAEIEGRNRKDWTPLYLAVEVGSDEAALLLIDRGANVNSRNDVGSWAPLVRAIRNRDLTVVRRLVEQGANIHYRSPLAPGVSTVGQAAKWGNWAAVIFLVEQGVAVDQRLSDGNTLLHKAAQNGRSHVVRFLIDHGAAVAVRNADDKTARDLALSAGHDDIVSLLDAAGVALETKPGRQSSQPSP